MTIPDRYIEAAVASSVERIREAGEGARRDTINRQAYGIGRLHPDGVPVDVWRVLLGAALSTGIPEREARSTLRHALADGSRQPVQVIGGRVDDTPPPPPDLRVPRECHATLMQIWTAMYMAPRGDEWLQSRGLHRDSVAWPTWSSEAWAARVSGIEGLENCGVGRSWGCWNGGVVIPIMTPMDSGPVAFRWRQHLHPAWKGAPKELSSYRSGEWAQWPLVDWDDPAMDRAPVVVVEGIPDWLTVRQRLRDRAWVWGLTGRWVPQHALAYLRGRRVVIATHDTGGEASPAERSISTAAGRVRWCRPAESNDWNDRHVDTGDLSDLEREMDGW